MKKIRDLFGPVLLVTVLLSGAYATPKPADAGVVTDAQTDAGTNPPKTVDAIDSGVLTGRATTAKDRSASATAAFARSDETTVDCPRSD